MDIADQSCIERNRMVLSCLVEPLVAPLVGAQRSRIKRSRLAATALACSALMAAVCPSQASKLADGAHGGAEKTVVRNAHAKPAPIPLRVVVEQYAVRRDEHLEIAAPGEAASFEQEAVFGHRLRHQRLLDPNAGPPMSRARSQHRRTRSVAASFRLFGSGQLRAGAPALI
ncbi:MAG: hypothetical protein RIT81_08960 [Deltaproteobacteria bacterium]